MDLFITLQLQQDLLSTWPSECEQLLFFTVLTGSEVCDMDVILKLTGHTGSGNWVYAGLPDSYKEGFPLILIGLTPLGRYQWKVGVEKLYEPFRKPQGLRLDTWQAPSGQLNLQLYVWKMKAWTAKPSAELLLSDNVDVPFVLSPGLFHSVIVERHNSIQILVLMKKHKEHYLYSAWTICNMRMGRGAAN